MRVRTIWIPPAIPLLTLAWIVGIFSLATAPLHELWRPLLVGTGAAVALLALTSVATRKNRQVTFSVGCLWLLALGGAALVGAIVFLLAWSLVSRWLRRRSGRPGTTEPVTAHVSRLATALAVGLVAVSSAWSVNSGAVVLGAHLAYAEGPTLSTDGGPNIYLVLLDGYPRADTLADTYGYDMQPFTDALAARGFEIAGHSRSNYANTLLTLNSMLHMAYIHEIDGLQGPPGSLAAQARTLTSALQAAPALATLKDSGYRVVSVSSAYGEAAIPTADEFRRSGSLTLFEETLLRLAPPGRWFVETVPDFVPAQMRSDVQFGLRSLPALARDSEDRQVALVHIFSPHAPAIFQADGRPAEPRDCYPEYCVFAATGVGGGPGAFDKYATQMRGQVEYLNVRLLEEIDRLIALDPTGVVILFSDHGARFEQGPADEHFHTFFATRTPGHDRLFPDDIAPVNVLPTLFNAYFGTELTGRPYRAWWSDSSSPLELETYEPSP